MAQTGGLPTTELNCQFLVGYGPERKEGRWKAPASGTYLDGTFVKKDATGLAWEQCDDNDATHIFEQPVVAAGAIGSAENREIYLQGFPQNIVANGAEITVFPASAGTIRTKVVATGSATGAIDTSTAVGTGVEAFNGLLRETQGVTDPIGETKTIMDSNGYIEIELY